MGFSIPHLLMVLVIVLLVFGSKRLKNLGEDLGDAIRGFHKAVKDGEVQHPPATDSKKDSLL